MFESYLPITSEEKVRVAQCGSINENWLAPQSESTWPIRTARVSAAPLVNVFARMAVTKINSEGLFNFSRNLAPPICTSIMPRPRKGRGSNSARSILQHIVSGYRNNRHFVKTFKYSNSATQLTLECMLSFNLKYSGSMRIHKHKLVTVGATWCHACP